MTGSVSKRVGAFAVASILAVAACSANGAAARPSGGASATLSSGPAASGSAASEAAVQGEVAISGSSTVQPISQAVAEAFNATQPDVAITVDGPGTGDGFKLFCTGEIDISDASRAIKDEEAKTCADAGIEFIELKVAIDGMSILTSINDSTGVECLSFADLYALLGPESEGFDNWKDGQALATELGSTTTLPDAQLTISGPGEESGTYDYFVETIVTPIAKTRSKDSVTRKDYNSSPNDNVIVQGIAGSDTSLGWVGYAYAEENLDKVKLLEVAKEPGKCVAATPETISDSRYPLSRPLFIYVNKAKAAANAAVAAFVDYYLAEGTIAAANETVGYIDLAPDVLAQSRSAWESR
ncbi:MAG: phosphate ABC transporter substrate-binding protein PstS family protein [Chloroflexota bacterium]